MLRFSDVTNLNYNEVGVLSIFILRKGRRVLNILIKQGGDLWHKKINNEEYICLINQEEPYSKWFAWRDIQLGWKQVEPKGSTRIQWYNA